MRDAATTSLYATLPVTPHGNRTAWRKSSCPWEETRHSCFFFSQPDAADIARRSGVLHAELLARMPSLNISAAASVRTLRGRKLSFVGDSVLRQLAEAFLCRLRDQVREDGFSWHDPTQRRVPSLDYKGMCPFGSRHCELGSGCAAFGSASMGRPTRKVAANETL